MTPFTIAHLSDLHLSAEHRRSHIKRARRALEYATTLGVDHVIVTGDITANGDYADYRVARSLFASAGLLDAGKLTVVVGNHDVYGGVHTAEDVLSYPKRCKAIDDKAKVREFAHAFHETFDRTLRHSDRRFFPFAKVLGDLAIIGVNSVAQFSHLNNPVGSNGEVDDKEFALLRELLESPLLEHKRKLVAIHHHFCRLSEVRRGTGHSVWGTIERQTMKLHGKSRLLRLFARTHVDLVLHGHVHESHEYFREGVRFVNAGGSTLHDRSPDLHITVVRITDAGCSIEMHRLATERAAPTALPEPAEILPLELEAHHEAA